MRYVQREKPIVCPVTLSSEEVEWVRSMVIYEDPILLALHKPSGLSSQGGRGQVHTLDELLWALAKPGKARPRLIHRLDRDTSGVILCAKTKPAAGTLGKAMMGRKFKKTYLAIVTPGAPEIRNGRVEAPMRRVEEGREAYMRVCEPDHPDAEMALSRYRTLAEGQGAALMELRPETGRMHQLRVHMASIGRPIAGDVRYGGALMIGGQPLPRLMLHAQALEFPHPDGGMKTVEAYPPQDFDAALAKAGLAVPVESTCYSAADRGRLLVVVDSVADGGNPMIGSLLALGLLAQQPTSPETLTPPAADTEHGEVRWKRVFNVTVEEASVWPKIPETEWRDGSVTWDCRRDMRRCEYIAYDADKDVARRVRIEAKTKENLSRGSVFGYSMARMDSQTPPRLKSAEPDLKLIHASTFPDWLHKPAVTEELERYFTAPFRAQLARVTGTAVLDCQIGESPVLEDCQVRTEYPKGFGFGEQARRSIRFYKIGRGSSLPPPLGSRTNIRIDFPTPPIPAPPVIQY